MEKRNQANNNCKYFNKPKVNIKDINNWSSTEIQIPKESLLGTGGEIEKGM